MKNFYAQKVKTIWMNIAKNSCIINVAVILNTAQTLMVKTLTINCYLLLKF